MANRLFTSEAVSEGHPDKVCDQIADRILDECLSFDEHAHVACEVLATNNEIIVGGEITPKPTKEDIKRIVKQTLKDIGYNSKELGTDYHTIKVRDLVKDQSLEIGQAVEYKEDAEELGAGDQGLMFGYATRESKEYMPIAYLLAQALVKEATKQRKDGSFPSACPDMKSQVTVEYDDLDHVTIKKMLMSIQQKPNTNEKEFEKYVVNNIMIPVAKSYGLNTDFKTYVNAGGPFTQGGPSVDTGLTGRKIIVDTYGGACEHGGGSFSGKDPTKVDRTGAYMARYIAKNLVAAGVADRILIQLSYSIGSPELFSLGFKTYHSSKYSDDLILDTINHFFDCRVSHIIENFSLTKPSFKYADLSIYGHFGRDDLDLPWERLDKVDEIKKYLKEKSKTL